ncbi:MAG: ribokinase, partial [Clostridiales bacterium]|nr:ribokinase [Clostridiales bacterium]
IASGAKALKAKGVGHVIVTLGSKGYCYFDGESVVYEDCIKANVVDTTAAGDTFCGALVTKLACGESLGDALRFANKAAAITVTRKGAGQSIPTLDEVAEIYG